VGINEDISDEEIDSMSADSDSESEGENEGRKIVGFHIDDSEDMGNE
jgi:hypothetical protein